MTDIVPPCDCAELVDGKWLSRCYCSNRDDGERAAAWCVETNCAARIEKLEAALRSVSVEFDDTYSPASREGRLGRLARAALEERT